MSDCVVTVPKNFTHPDAPGKKGLAAWVAEGQLPGDPESRIEWEFTTWGSRPCCYPGDRLYIVCEGRLRGYAPIVRVECDAGRIVFVRWGDAVAVTIDERIRGFQGWRYRWWFREKERPFPDWRESADQIVRQATMLERMK